MGSSWAEELALAARAARKAGELALGRQRGIRAEKKSDDSPVTQADRECERLIAGILNDAFPEDGILGEEGARAESRNGRKWIIDPIDGTRDYVRGDPLWANLIALEVEGDVVVGVVNLPPLGLFYSAGRGGGAYCNDERIRASSITSITEAVLCCNGLNKLEGVAFRDRLLDWMAHFWSIRALGGPADAMMVAAGQAEIWIEPSAATWDFAPLKVILEEAGALFLNLDGGSSIYAGNGVACVPGLEKEVRRFFVNA